MDITVIGAGRIAGQLAAAGHRVAVSRDRGARRAFAAALGARVAEPAAAVQEVVLSGPWSAIPAALEQTGPRSGKVVIGTTNQIGAGPKRGGGQTAAAFNAARMPGARYTESFNTLTADFQARTADRDPRVVQRISGDDPDARALVAGHAEYELGDVDACAIMEAPRLAGAFHGEAYRLADALEVRQAVAAGRPIPPTPAYPG